MARVIAVVFIAACAPPAPARRPVAPTQATTTIEIDRDACRRQSTIARTERSVAQIEQLVRLWIALRDKLPASEAKACHDDAAELSSERARTLHAQANGDPAQLADAERLYELHLSAFPDADDVSAIQYYEAELLWTRAERERRPREQAALWERAARAFTAVNANGKLDAKLKLESAYSAVLSWNKAISLDPPLDVPAGDSKPRPRPIPDRERQLLGALAAYAGLLRDPNDDERVSLQFLAATIYRRYDHLDEVIPYLQDIVAHHADHEDAPLAAKLLLEAYRRTGRVDDARTLERGIIRGERG